MTSTIPATKQQIRQQARWLRDSQFQTRQNLYNQVMWGHLKNWMHHHNPTNIGLYASKDQETNTQVIFDELISQNKICWFPKVEGQNMNFFHVAHTSDLQKGAFDILEPTSTKQALMLDLLIVPALAVDTSGNRLGFGKGYYDRFIQTHKPKQTMAWVHAYQVWAKLPTQAHDQPLDWIATEKGIRRVL